MEETSNGHENGNGKIKPYCPTDDEKEERTEFVAALMAAGHKMGTIKRAFRAKYGEVTHETIYRYVSRAKEWFAKKAASKERNEWVGESIDFYETLKRDPKARPIDKIKAQERIDLILGLEAPQRRDVTATIEVENNLPKLPKERLRELIQLNEARPTVTVPTNGNGNGSNGH